jgi:endonuclease G, mitochondrial
MKKIFITLLIVLFSINLTAQTNITLIHKANITVYDTKKKIPLYSRYILTKNQPKKVSRPGVFTSDPNLDKSLQLGAKDYSNLNKGLKTKNETFDKGHLSPADDFRNDSIEENESMFYTNVAPQNSAFNEVQWRKLENYVRSLALKYDTLIITTGCITTNNTIKGIYIPDYYFKQIIIIKCKHDTLTYKMPNKADDKDFSNYKLLDNTFINLFK